MTMPVPNTNPSTSNPAPEPKIETPPTPTEAKPARPRIAFSSLNPAERLYVCRVAANQQIGGKLPLSVREAILADYEGVPSAAFAPDPTGPGWADKISENAEKVLMAVIGLAAGAVGLLLLVETGKAVLRSLGAMAPAASPKALPVEVSVSTEATDTVSTQG